MKRITGLLLACVIVFGIGPLRAEDVLVGSVKKLPGCGDLPARMAKYYKPVKVDVKPAAPQYKLPLDLTKLTNADFAGKIHELRNKAVKGKFDAALTASGFAAMAGGRSDDVAGFYNSVKQRGLPVFITSDSLLHLYHIQFGETLKAIEEREFFNDATLISKAIQAEALKLYKSTDGELKEAARLLVGYATVPVVILSQTDFGAEAAAALKEVNSWPEKPTGHQYYSFHQKNKEVIDTVVRELRLANIPRMLNATQLKAILEKYIKAHPADKDPGDLIPKIVDKEVRAELELIAAHKGFDESPLFIYKEDYSQYVPRGHYTRSKKLKQYFKALMWYGRMTFIIRGKTKDTEGRWLKAVVSVEEARRQTLAAAMLAGMMEKNITPGRTIMRSGMRSRFLKGRTLAEAWDRMYSVTAYYVGFADDLTPYEYRKAIRSVMGEAVKASSLTDAKKFFEYRKALAQLRKPEIYSGLGDLVGPPAGIADEATLAKALGLTQGMRLMGQRYIPDSYMMGKMVYPTVGLYRGGENKPFTWVMSDGGPIRGFPRGLDVMTVLGSDRARHWTKKLGDDQYKRYDETLAKLQKQFGEIDQAGWNRNMYWSWLYALKSLVGEYPKGYPTFMQTDAWRDKQLSAALASWSQLRHDTILYAKQSYTMKAGFAPARPKMVEGYVEPVPEFYARLLALTRMTIAGLDDFKVLDKQSRSRLVALEKIVARLLAISQAELANKKLTKDDYAFIRSFGSHLKYVVAGVNSDGLQTTIVADVHTDGNSRQVLEEGTGYLHTMVVVYPMPDGGLVAGVGPVLTHYEFKHPMSDRLTDEAWKKMLRTKTPKLPDWAKTFTVTQEK
jgi:hypothetical protein